MGHPEQAARNPYVRIMIAMAACLVLVPMITTVAWATQASSPADTLASDLSRQRHRSKG